MTLLRGMDRTRFDPLVIVRRVDSAYGARYHAERAVEEAREAADEERVAAAQAWLERLPPAGAEQPGAQP